MSLRARLRDALAALRGRPRRRSYAAGQLTRLSNTWQTDPGSINRSLRYELRTLRARARQLSENDGYAAKFLGSCVANIAGPQPFRLQAKIKRPRGTLDSRANRMLETAWREWTTTECDAAGRSNLDAIHRTVIRCLARDGEVLIRYRIEGAHGLRLQVLDIDRLDEERNEQLAGGNVIKMGVELNGSGRPVAYHLLREHPGEVGLWNTMGLRESLRVDAREILHVFVPHSAEQVRGVPWMAPVMARLWNISGFEEAAVISARTGASKMGFYVSPDGALPATVSDGTDSSGRFVQDAEPGTFEVLPSGYDFKTWDPQFPDTAVEPFIRTTLRGIAAGLGIAYHSLANDPSNVNYSTARVALLEERDVWGSIQAWYVDHVCRPIFEEWRSAAVSKKILPNDALADRYGEVWWQCKTWDWVDPLKDTQAEIEALKTGLTSRTRIAAERGRDIEDIFDEIAAENALAAEKGLELSLGGEPPELETEPEGSDEQEEQQGARALRVVG